MEQAMEASTYTEENKPGLSELAQGTQPAPETTETKAPEDEAKSTLSVQTDDTGSAEAQAKEPKEDSPIPAPQTQNEAKAVLSKEGLDIAEFENEFMANGQLSDDSYTKLEKAGIPKALVDSYIKGQTAIAEKFVAEVKALAGGDEGYTKLADWVAGNIPEDEVKAYNSVMASGNKAMIKLAVSGMLARYKAQADITPPKLAGGKANAGNKTGEGFSSMHEMMKAMQDKRYGRDPAYTRMIEQRVANSTF